MIVAGSRDGRKGLDINFNCGRQMDETELEEGEACSYHNSDGSTIDPDVTLSYIGEKLQHVLGHFQKDFEGGVSAENLGAKFGGYGSFLPTYQRSPVLSHPRTSPEPQNRPRFSDVLASESGHNSSLDPSVTSVSGRPGSFPVTAASVSTLKVPSMDDSIKGDKLTSTTSTSADDGLTSSIDHVIMLMNPSDKKSLKVRIKGGSGNLSMQKNAEIYSGLGLDVSPSSSMEDSPTGSEGNFHEQFGSDESPTSILQIMTSFPVDGSNLLSPLSDCLIQFTERRKSGRQCKTEALNKEASQNSSVLVNGSDFSRSDIKVLGEKVPRSSDIKFCFQGAGQVERFNVKSSPTVNGREVKGSLDEISVQSKKEGKPREEKSDISTKADINASLGGEALDTEQRDSLKEKGVQVATSSNENGAKLSSGKENSSMGKKKPKESLSHNVPEMKLSKDSSNIDSSVPAKSKTVNDDKHYLSMNEKEDVKKGSGRTADRYRDFFGELEPEGDIEMKSEKTPSTNQQNKQRPHGKIMNLQSTSDTLPAMASNKPSVAGNRHIPDAAPGTINPMEQEDWVCCDKCQTWRLLPLGTNPDSLPEKWVCSMLSWLPGMNRCGFSEEETTKALRALYQLPAPAIVSHSGVHDHPVKLVSGISSIDVQHVEENHPHTILSKTSNGKKKDRFKDGSDAMDQDGFSNSMNKNLHADVKNTSSNIMNQSLILDDQSFQHFDHHSKIAGGKDKHRHRHKEKSKIPDSHSDGGDKKKAKVKNKRETDTSRSSKKAKMNGVHYSNGSDHGGDNLKKVYSLSNDVSLNVLDKLNAKYHSISKDSNCDSKVKLSAPVKNPEQIQTNLDNQSLYTGKLYDVKKRKGGDCQGTESYDASAHVTGHHLQEFRNLMEETCDNDHKKRKTKMSCSEGKETTGSKVNSETDKACKVLKEQKVCAHRGSTRSQCSMEGIDSLKRDISSIHPLLPATSSSSKVSGSHKNRSGIQVKGSPVESVSSSPLRISSRDKFTSKTKLVGGDDTQDTNCFAISSPRRSSDIEDGDGGSDRSGTVRVDDTFNVMHHGSLESSVLDFQDRDLGCVSGTKAKSGIVSSTEFPAHDFTDLDEHLVHHSNGGYSKKPEKGLSLSQSKEKNHTSRKEIKKSKVRTSELVDASIDYRPSPGEQNKLQEKPRVSSDKVGKNCVSDKESSRKLLSDTSEKVSRSKFGGSDCLDVKIDAFPQVANQILVMGSNNDRFSKRLPSDSKDCIRVSEMGKFQSLSSTASAKNELIPCPESAMSVSQKENVQNISLASEGSGACKLPKQIKKDENQNGIQLINSRHMPNRNKVRDLDGLSPDRRHSSSQDASNVIKEAKDLKHMADRLKNSGSTLQSRGLYFQAALKFLHGSALLESSCSDGTKHGEMVQLIQLYSSTAKLCEFCAHEFEKSKEMAATALAYKCMEVAYMRVIYSSNGSSSRARQELQTALHIVPPVGESPSSSASDVDNLNNPTATEKVVPAKGVGSPLVTGLHLISAQNRSSILRLLNFAQNANFAMEASRKSRIAFAAASQGREEIEHKEATPVKRALDFNFHDVEGLLRLVRLAMETINH